MTAAKRIASLEVDRLKRSIGSQGVDGVLDTAFWSYTKKVFRPLILYLRRLAVEGKLGLIEELSREYEKLAVSVERDSRGGHNAS
jgi:hypothetical protein